MSEHVSTSETTDSTPTPTTDGRARKPRWRATAAVTSGLFLVLAGCTSAPDTAAAPPSASASSSASTPPSASGVPSTTPGSGSSGASTSPSSSSGGSGSSSSSTGPTASATDSPPADALLLSIFESGGKVTPNGQKINVRVGQQVTLDVTSDRDDEIHAHTGGDGYELEVKAGVPTTGSFTLDSAGSFEVESHKLEKVIVILNAR
jgi:hypothetical protein